jgi:stage IV sporulation protein FB
VHVSFFLLVALFALASTGPGGQGLLSGLSWLVILFACVVVHELAHCVVGQAHGAVVRDIVLLPIGGMSRLERLPPRPEDELAMAIAGPIASAALGVAAGAVAGAVGVALLPVDLATGSLLARLCWVNLLLAAFNLLPAFPLDGGRVLRALLARHHGEAMATRRAATVGRVVAVVMIAAGVLVDLWLLIIGMFVFFAATAEERATLQHLRLRGVHVRDLMRTPTGGTPRVAFTTVPLTALGADDDVEDDLPALVAAPSGALPVVDHTQVVGELRVGDVTDWLRACAEAENGHAA